MKQGFKVIIKSGLFEWKLRGKNQPGLDLERALVDFMIAKGIASNNSGDCCSLSVQFPKLSSTQYTAWTQSFNTTTHVEGLNGDPSTSRQGEVVYNLATSKLVVATWTGSAWSFVNLH
jgi:hypothetical protein